MLCAGVCLITCVWICLIFVFLFGVYLGFMLYRVAFDCEGVFAFAYVAWFAFGCFALIIMYYIWGFGLGWCIDYCFDLYCLLACSVRV